MIDRKISQSLLKGLHKSRFFDKIKLQNLKIGLYSILDYSDDLLDEFLLKKIEYFRRYWRCYCFYAEWRATAKENKHKQKQNFAVTRQSWTLKKCDYESLGFARKIRVVISVYYPVSVPQQYCVPKIWDFFGTFLDQFFTCPGSLPCPKGQDFSIGNTKTKCYLPKFIEKCCPFGL